MWSRARGRHVAGARDITTLLGPLHRDHDIVLVDQRGTGGSGATRCPALDGPPQVAACAARLGARRAFLNTTETALDLEDLRVALGAAARRVHRPVPGHRA